MKKTLRFTSILVLLALIFCLGAASFAFADDGAYDYSSLLPDSPSSIYGYALKKNLDGTSYPASDWDKVALVCDTYNNRLDKDGLYKTGYSGHLVTKTALDVPISFYYADGILYYAEVRSSTDVGIIDYQLYYFKDQLVAYRHLPDLCLRFSNYENDREDFNDILEKYGSVYAMGMMEENK